MARTTNSQIMERLDALTAEVESLRGEVESLRGALAQRATAPAARATVASAMDTLVVPQELNERQGDAPLVPVVDPATPEELLEELFVAAAMEDSEAGFERFTMLMHPRALDGPRALSSLKAFQWKQIRKNFREYLDATGRFDSFHVIDRRPDPLTPRDETCKMFLHSSRRMPVPLQLRRLDDDPSRWRIEVCSL